LESDFNFGLKDNQSEGGDLDILMNKVTQIKNCVFKIIINQVWCSWTNSKI